MYYTLIKHAKNGNIYRILKRSYYSKKENGYLDASTTFLDKKEYEFLKDTFDKNNIKYQEFDNTKGD